MKINIYDWMTEGVRGRNRMKEVCAIDNKKINILRGLKGGARERNRREKFVL